MDIKQQILKTDILIIGGGTAGCYAAITIAEEGDAKVIIAEKAHIKRSGCLAAGVNALNAYIVKGNSPEDYLEYVKKDANGLIREDLVLTMSQGLNRVTHHLEELGLVIQKDENGDYVTRGNRNIKINGENIKPILASAVYRHKQIEVINKINITDYIIEDNRIIGAYGFSFATNSLYIIYAKAVICATGGASGIYKPNNPGFSKHKMWYPPFNTGAGYAMGIRSGAEMTTFEMRFIALRCKDTIAPTGTIAQGVKAPQINSKGESYDHKYGEPTTANRVYSTVEENKQGRGPCFLKTVGISEKEEEELLKAYLNMAPAQTLKWIEKGKGPALENVEIEGTEPYIVGGHTSSGYWISTKRETTIKGLYAAGDVAGGCPQKYVTGSLVEGEIAAKSALEYSKKEYKYKKIENEKEYKYENKNKNQNSDEYENLDFSSIRSKITKYLDNPMTNYTVDELEEAMQKVMDEYAGGIASNYSYNEVKLNMAYRRIEQIETLAEKLHGDDLYDVMKIYELIDRLLISKVLIEHLKARKETRWHSFQENDDYKEINNEEFFLYINSVLKDNKVSIIKREFIDRRQTYEHSDR